MSVLVSARRVDSSRRRTLHGAAPLTALEQLAGHLPEFMHTGTSKSIPPTVTARGYDRSMPVAYEPETTQRRREDTTNRQNNPTTEDKPLSNRRSTMPSASAMAHIIQSPPLLYPSLTPSCDLCSSDLNDSITHCSHIWCEECDLALCGSEAIEDGMPGHVGSTSYYAKPKDCNYRLHRHTVMQSHVRIAASTMMQIEKLLHAEKSKAASDPSKKSRKDIVLQVFSLPMKGVCWKFQSLTRPSEWIEFDLHTSDQLEATFSKQAQQGGRRNMVKIGEQYEVHLIPNDTNTRPEDAPQSTFYLLHTLSQRKTAVRRLSAGVTSSESDSTPACALNSARPNSRPTSARPTATTTGSTPPSPPGVGGVAPITLHVDAQLASSAPSNASTPAHASTSVGSTPTGAISPSSGASTSRRPALQRHVSFASQLMSDYAGWSSEDWAAFASEQKELTPGMPGSVGHELEEVSEEQQVKETLYPIFDMERGNGLLLAVYHNASAAALSLHRKGYSANSVSSWTKLSALQFACMNGNLSLTRSLLDFGGDLCWKSPTSSTLALEYAVKSGSVELVKLLLELRKATPTRCIAYSDVILREQRKNRNKKRSTWIDIGAENDANGEDGLTASLKKGIIDDRPTPVDNGIGSPHDEDAQLYPHLLTEALNVPPVLSHSLGVVDLLLDRMLARAPSSPAFELSRYHEWLSACVASGSVERVRLMLDRRARDTSHLTPIETISEDFQENITNQRYARTIVKQQTSIDLLFFQACQNQPASQIDEEDDEEEEDGDQDEDHVTAPAPDGGASNSSAGGPFALLRLIIISGADLNHVDTDRSDGTQLSPLFIALRDRKFHLARFLVSHGADPSLTLRVTRLDLPADHSPGPSEVCATSSTGSVEWFGVLGWTEYCSDEVGYSAEELATVEELFNEATRRRHEKARRMVQAVLQITQSMADATNENRIERPFDERILHVIATFCFGHHTLHIGASVSTTGVTLSRPSSPPQSP